MKDGKDFDTFQMTTTCDWAWQVNLFLDFQAQKIMNKAIHIHYNTESFCQQDDALYLVWSEGCGSFWAVTVWRNG